MKTIYSFIYYIKFVMSLYFIFNDNLNVYSELLFISNLIELSSHNFYNNNILFNSVSKICSFIFLLLNLNIRTNDINKTLPLNDIHIFNPPTHNLNSIDLISVTSPLIYFNIIKFFKNNRENYIDYINLEIMKVIKYDYNIFMSLWSLCMCYMMTISVINSEKYSSINDLVCKKFDETYILNTSIMHFYYSKYAEWIDTIFIIIFNKPLINLHYYHHASTAYLVYINSNLFDITSSFYCIPLILNTGVHTIMYLYYAIPAKMQWCKSYITKIQITQHIICLIVLMYTLNKYINNEYCYNQIYGIISGIILYMYYLIAFINFYIKTYIIKRKKKD